MREIKFRAWNRDRNQFVDDSELKHYAITFDGKIINFDSSGYDYIEHFDVVRYTGLEDWKGVDIYEGDIVEYETSQSKTRGLVEYGSGLYGWVHAGIWFHMWDMHLDSAEVIGNIYENPELLEQQ